MSFNADFENEPEENYYAFLNLPKDASAEQINTAYRKLSRIYHPDKHIGEDNKQKAEVLFNRTKKAYEVLSDPHKRAIYDSLGEKGLKEDGWELVYRTKTPEEIREEYERLAAAAEERKLLQRTNPRGNVTIGVNATEIFTPYDESDLPKIEVSSMSISQSIEVPVTRRDTLTLSGNLMSSNGNGSGNFVLSGRRLLNKGWLELVMGAGGGPLLGIKGGRAVSSKVSVNGGTSITFHDTGVLPAFFTTLAVQLSKFTVGSLVLNGGAQTSMTTQVDSSSEQYNWSVALIIGSPHIYCNFSCTRKLIENEMKIKLATKVGTFGFLTEYGAEKKVSKYSSVFASVSVGVPSGVMLKFKLIRSNQSYIFPIRLSEEIVPAAVFYATLSPFLVWFFIKKSVIDPLQEEMRHFEVEKSKRNNEQRLARKRQEAESAIELMQHTYERNVLEETERNGLIITSALYGVLDENGTEFQADTFIDVKIPLQCLVRDSKLVLYNATKSELPGFYDPAFGENKTLKIDYTFRGESRTVTVSDLHAIEIPADANR